MKENICLHALNTNCNYYRSFKNIEVLTSVLKTGALLSRRKQHYTESKGFNGLDYISLCDYEKRHIHPDEYPKCNAYESYAKEYISLIFPKDKLEIINPTIITLPQKGLSYYDTICHLGMSKERYSDLPDEVHVKDEIPLDLMSGITLPLHRIHCPSCLANSTTKAIIKDLKKMKALLLKYGYNVPIYDINTMEELNDELVVKKLVNKYNQKIY